MNHVKKQTLPAPKPASNGLPRVALAACILIAGGGAWTFAEFVLWNKLPSELVGKWVVEGGDQDGATFDFYRGGTMEGRINVNGRMGIVKARVDIEGDRLLATTQNPNTKAMEPRTHIIVRLTKTQLILRDERGVELRMFRAE